MLTKIQIKVTDSTQLHGGEADLEEYCPHCGKEVMPIVIFAVASKKSTEEKNEVAVLTRCPRSECGKYNIQAYLSIKSRSHIGAFYEMTRLKYTYHPPLENDLPRKLNEAFPAFKEIYDQSLKAESMGLDQIAGIGFRKSLEFLIKSYAISKDPDNQSKIEKETLSNTIKNRYGDFPKIQKLAELAAWIGNDETHFVKKHTEINISNMKEFLNAAALFIAADMEVDFATAYIEESKAKS